MTVYVSETPDGNLRIVRAGEDVRCVVSGNTVTVDSTTPDWYRRIAAERGYELVESAAEATASAVSEVSSD